MFAIQATFISIVADLIQQFQVTELTPSYQLTTVGKLNLIRDGSTVYGTGPEVWGMTSPRGHHGNPRPAVKAPGTVYRVTNDPVDLACKAEVIKRQYVPFYDSMQWYIDAGGSVYPQSASKCLIMKGPNTGRLVQATVPDRISSGIQAALKAGSGSAVEMLNDYLTIAQAMGALARWSRKLPDIGDQVGIAPDGARFDNVLVPTYSDAMVNALGDYIRTGLPPSLDYVAAVSPKLTEITKASLSDIVSYLNDDPLPLTLHFVDITLKRLAAYMLERRIPFAMPGVWLATVGRQGLFQGPGAGQPRHC